MEEFTITNCARCGETHPVTFQSLTNPFVVYDLIPDEKGGFRLTQVKVDMWGMCPKLNEPIMMDKINPYKENFENEGSIDKV